MTEKSCSGGASHRALKLNSRSRRRRITEKIFRGSGAGALVLALAALALLFISIVGRAAPVFFQYFVRVPIEFSADVLDPGGARLAASLAAGDYTALVRRGLAVLFPEVADRSGRRKLFRLVSDGAVFELRERVLEEPDWIGQQREIQLLLSDEADLYFKSKPRGADSLAHAGPNSLAHIGLDADQIAWLESLRAQGRVSRSLNLAFFRAGDSREPELAGIGGAFVGSLLTLAVTFLLSFPLGGGAAIYLEEFARKNRFTDWIEVSINNLAAVPSIVFGLLGLAIFLNVFGMPRSAPLAGGCVLALMTLPTLVIAARAALLSVPGSVREAALALGASPVQVVMHHVFPLALPGILTGTIIGMARALGETAPLLMIGMVAFIADIPRSLSEPATVLPVQIFLWADSPERAFVAKTAAATLVLLAFLVVMNLGAVLLRKKFERRW